jgi:hypothetical protein
MHHNVAILAMQSETSPCSYCFDGLLEFLRDS